MRRSVFILICALLLVGCGGCQEKNIPPQLTDKQVEQGLINMHRMELGLESKRIDLWLSKKG